MLSLYTIFPLSDKKKLNTKGMTKPQDLIPSQIFTYLLVSGTPNCHKSLPASIIDTFVTYASK